MLLFGRCFAAAEHSLKLPFPTVLLMEMPRL